MTREMGIKLSVCVTPEVVADFYATWCPPDLRCYFISIVARIQALCQKAPKLSTQ